MWHYENKHATAIVKSSLVDNFQYKDNCKVLYCEMNYDLQCGIYENKHISCLCQLVHHFPYLIGIPLKKRQLQ